MKKSIKIHQIIIATMVALLSFGCEKDDDQDLDTDDNPSGYFVKAKVDGTLVEFKTATLINGAMGNTLPGVYDLTVSGARQMSGQSALAESISIILRVTSPITENSYSGLEPFEYGLKGVLLGYTLESENRAYTTDSNAANSFLEITEIKEASLKGKFNGVVKDILSGETKTITEGEFFVKRNN
jgi:hypothetical protein